MENQSDFYLRAPRYPFPEGDFLREEGGPLKMLAEGRLRTVFAEDDFAGGGCWVEDGE